MVTQVRLKELFKYDPENGVFIRLVKVRPSTHIGEVAGFQKEKYWQIKVDGKHYYAHRLAWLYMTGSFPEHHIDHKDGDPLNNKWNNLRDATRIQNGHNRKMPANNTSGHKGVTYNIRAKKWYVYCTINKIHHFLGGFDDPELGGLVYDEFTRKHHGEFYRATS